MSGRGLDARLRRSVLVVVGVIVAALLVAVGLFALGRSTAQPQVVTVTATASASVEQQPAAEPLPVVGVEPVQTTVPLVFQAGQGLADDGGFAIGYQLVDTDIDRMAFARFLAEVFGVDGEPVQAADGSVTIGRTSLLTVGAGSAVTWDVALGSAPTVGRVLADDDAMRAARSLLAQLGVDDSEVDWQVTTSGHTTTVTAWEKLDGRRTGLSWAITLGPRGQVIAAHGFAGTLAPTRAYPVLGAATALQRAQLPGWSAFGPSLITPAPEGAAPTPTATQTQYGDRPLVIGEARTRVITAAELGLAQHRQPDGSLLIVPAYVLTADDGSTWSLVAVTDSYADLRQPLPSASVTPSPEAS